jgi:tight adherence protein B
MDVSNSMQRENRFEEAKIAARAFLKAAPDDLYIGIVTFADEVVVAQEPSLDRDASQEIIDGLELSPQTLLHEGIIQAVKTAGTEGSRSLLVLSDGRDTTETSIEDVVATIDDAEIRTDVIALSVPPAGQAALDQFARAGGGSTINAEDPAALTDLFTAEAEALARQVLITADASRLMGSPTPARRSSTSARKRKQLPRRLRPSWSPWRPLGSRSLSR